uniref:Uncharacterized protein n=1 Tax=Rhizophora mucronata TaxID=61149 RepID=A0A2P2PJJ6_RHIMU
MQRGVLRLFHCLFGKRRKWGLN